MGNNIFYVYEWFIVDTIEVFYVGKGKNLRRFEEKYGRNGYFKNIVNKYPCAVRIFQSYLSEEDAFGLETERIAYYKTRGQAKANFTKGGSGGNVQIYYTKEQRRKTKEKMSEAQLVRWEAITIEERKLFGKKISKSLKENESVVGSRNPMYGKTHTEEARLKISETHKGKTLSKFHIQQLKERNSGEGNPMYGVSLKDIMSVEDFRAYQERHRESCQTGEYRKLKSEEAKKRLKNKENHPLYGKAGENAVNGVQIAMLNEDGIAVRNFNTVTLVLEFLGIKGHSQLYKAIRNQTKYRDYYWKRL